MREIWISHRKLRGSRAGTRAPGRRHFRVKSDAGDPTRIRITQPPNRPIILARKHLLCTAPLKCVMTNLSKILSLENVVLDLEVSSKKRAFEQAGLIFENNCGIARSTVSDNLFARERLGSTGLGHGVAVPHGRIKGRRA